MVEIMSIIIFLILVAVAFLLLRLSKNIRTLCAIMKVSEEESVNSDAEKKNPFKNPVTGLYDIIYYKENLIRRKK